jgi:hypothetical protein
MDDVSLTRDGGPNQLVNGDFSLGLGHWGYNDDNPSATRSLNTTDFHSAPASYQFNRNGGLGSMNTYYDTISQSVFIPDAGAMTSTTWITVTEGEEIELSFWYKGSLAFVRAFGRLSGGGDQQLFLEELPAVADWASFSVTATIPISVEAVLLRFAVRSEIPTAYNSVLGNKIGTNAAGTGAIPNNGGIEISRGARQNTIGGSVVGAGNLVSGNNNNGVNLSGLGTISNTVLGNYIGTDVGGTTSLNNAINGVRIETGASGNVIGGANPTPTTGCTGGCNLISGNYDSNLLINNSNGNTVQGNYIGPGYTGSSPVTGIPDGGDRFGIELDAAASFNTIGGNSANTRNLISDNDQDGIRVGNRCSTNTITGNWIGVIADGSSAWATATEALVSTPGHSITRSAPPPAVKAT